MRSTHLHHPLIILFLLFNTLIVNALPRLTVVVVVDGMTSENLSDLRPYWPAGGLRTLSEEAFQTTMDFPHLVYGGQETLATMMTGTTPDHHGVMADSYFSRTDRKVHATLEDKQSSGIGTGRNISPRAILSTSLTDTWRIQQGEHAKIYAVGLQPEATVLLAGHAANACCWLDPKEQRWVTTAFYPEGLPAAADEMNMNGRIAELANRVWTPRLDISMYMHPTAEERKHQYSYTPGTQLLNTPAANTLIVEMALALQKDLHIGTDNTPDLLLLQMTTISPHATSDALSSAEQEDMYLGINQDLGFLMEQLDKRIGKAQYQLLVIGRPVLGYNPQTFEKAGIPVQHFNVDRAAALTGTYLMAIYGHERWVDGGYGPYIYLNRTLIEQKRLSLETFQRQVANFLMDFEGVQVAVPIHEALTTTDGPYIYRKQAGDVYFRLQDNWLLDADDHTPFDHVIQSNPTAPLLLWSGTMRTFPEGELHATDIKSLILK